jgi:hypothetical protein
MDLPRIDESVEACSLIIWSYIKTSAIPQLLASTLPRSPTCRLLSVGDPWCWLNGLKWGPALLQSTKHTIQWWFNIAISEWFLYVANDESLAKFYSKRAGNYCSIKFTISVTFLLERLKWNVRLNITWCIFDWILMKGECKQWWSTITSISTKQTITFHLHSLNTNTTHDAENPGSALEQAQKCAGVKPVNGIPTLIWSNVDNAISLTTCYQ